MISLYRGELHKVSGVPRQWTVPKSTIPVSVFVKALKKRNAALLRELQSSSSPENLLLPSSVTPVRPGESINLTPLRATGELIPPEIIVSRTGYGVVGCSVEESINTTLAGKRAESSERIEDESEVLQERKRKKQEDTREETERHTPKDEQRNVEAQGKKSATQDKDSVQGLESMSVDVVDQSEEMDCDIVAVEKADDIAEQSRVRVSETGTITELEMGLRKRGGSDDSNDEKGEKVYELARNEEEACPQARENNVPSVLVSTSALNVNRSPEDFSKGTDIRDVVGEKLSEKTARKRKRKGLLAKLEKLTSDKHHLVLMLKQVLNEEESKKRVSSNAPQHAGQGVSAAGDTAVIASHGEKLGGLQASGDLEEGELEYARTPSPPPRPVQNIHSNLSSHNPLGLPPPMVPILGRQNTLTQHISQGSSGRGGYYVPGTGIPPSPVGPGIGGGGALSPGAVYMGNLPSPLGPHNYSHNLALQHAAAIHAQKIVPVPPVHGQFNPIPPNGAPLGAGPGVAGGPPGFGGYVVPPPLHPHHPHLSQTAATSTSHIPVQQGVVSSSLLTTPRGPVGYHDMRLGSNAWIPR